MLLTVTTAAERAGFHRSYIKAEIARGNLQARKLGNQYVIEESDFAAWMANPRRGSRSTGERQMDRTAQVNWMDHHVVSFILDGGSGDYDATDMGPGALAEYMYGYWLGEVDELPEWWSDADRAYCVGRLTESFASQRDEE